MWAPQRQAHYNAIPVYPDGEGMRDLMDVERRGLSYASNLAPAQAASVGQ